MKVRLHTGLLYTAGSRIPHGTVCWEKQPGKRGQPVELLCVRPASGRFEKYALGTVIQARRKSLCSGEDRSMRTLRNLGVSNGSDPGRVRRADAGRVL